MPSILPTHQLHPWPHLRVKLPRLTSGSWKHLPGGVFGTPFFVTHVFLRSKKWRLSLFLPYFLNLLKPLSWQNDPHQMRFNCRKIPLVIVALETFVESKLIRSYKGFLSLVQIIWFTTFGSTMSTVPITTIVPPGIEALVTSAKIPRWVSILCKG